MIYQTHEIWWEPYISQIADLAVSRELDVNVPEQFAQCLEIFEQQIQLN